MENNRVIRPLETGVMWRVVGDHPILKRSDKGGMTKAEAGAYAAGLRGLGYENVQVLIEEK